jgi:hypothetical protein
MDEIITGGCLCGDIRYHIDPTPVEAPYCHCKMCRSAHHAPVVAWLTVSCGRFQSPRAILSPTLLAQGDPLLLRPRRHAAVLARDRHPLLIDVSVATLDDLAPAKPSLHIWTDSRIVWFETADHLPCYPTNERPSSAA